MRVLLVEDEGNIAETICDMFKASGFVTDWAASLEDASIAKKAAPYDIILLDRSLPDGDGLAWLKTQRQNGCRTPTLIVTGKQSDVCARIEGLNAGADDYITKPFVAAELVARVRAVLRRPITILEPILRAGNVEYNPSSRQLWVDEIPTHIPRREGCLLEILMRRLGRVVPRSALEGNLYSYDDEVSANALEVGIYRLRSYLRTAGAAIRIRTVRGIGYCLEDRPLQRSGNIKCDINATML